jgi:biofilm PGA synthesis N-glycosyltransferase PgaC
MTPNTSTIERTESPTKGSSTAVIGSGPGSFAFVLYDFDQTASSGSASNSRNVGQHAIRPLPKKTSGEHLQKLSRVKRPRVKCTREVDVVGDGGAESALGAGQIAVDGGMSSQVELYDWAEWTEANGGTLVAPLWYFGGAAAHEASGELVTQAERIVIGRRTDLGPVEDETKWFMTVLIAAHNEEESIGSTLDSVLAQERQPDLILVAADNCTDDTVAIASSKPGVTVYITVDNTHKKAGALNQAWGLTRELTDLYVCIDADTMLPPDACGVWEQEFLADSAMAGCSAKFTMLSPQELTELSKTGQVPVSAGDLPDLTFRERMWCRVQKAEFAKWTDTALIRKGNWTSVLAGTACAIRAETLEEVVALRDKGGEEPHPWTYVSEVEDFELTYRFRQLGYSCRVSPNVRAYTGAMLTLKTLWAQRLKWQVGTARDLKKLGLNKLTLVDWWQQLLGLIAAMMRVMWVFIFISVIFMTGHVHVIRYWWVFPVVFVACDVREAMRIPHRTKADVLTAAALVPQEIFAWLRAAWFAWSWVEVISGRQRDRWALQIAAEERG